MSETEQKKNPWKEITQPFIDLVHAPRAIKGINIGYFLEGFIYFGMLTYLAMHFSDFVFSGIEKAEADISSHLNVAFLTWGITFSMFLLGGVADKLGVRKALLISFATLFIGRLIISLAPVLGLQPAGLWSPLHITTLFGILVITVGYGFYEPAAYSGIRKFTTPKTAAMGYAMLYAIMNLGGWLPSFFGPIRNRIGIIGSYWIFTFFTFLALILTYIILTKKTVQKAISDAEAATEKEKSYVNKKEKAEEKNEKKDVEKKDRRIAPAHLWIFIGIMAGFTLWQYHGILSYIIVVCIVLIWIATAVFIPATARWLANHPLANSKFFFFIFALIPVQTLFTYNWLILPQYINRAYEGWIGRNFEVAANFNPLGIFIAVPIIAALTYKKKVYNLMIIGTLIMAAPAFLLALGTNIWLLGGYLIIMTIGEAIWQPRFLQFAVEIAPKDRVGAYVGVSRFPWFLTKMLVPLYSGKMIARYCPVDGPKDPQTMWLIFAIIAISSTIILVIARKWAIRGFVE